jgi:hypothetical protein
MKNSREDFVFSVKVPYSTAPDIVKLKEDYRLTPISEEMLAFKLEELTKFPNDVTKEIVSEELSRSLEIICQRNNLPNAKTILDLAKSVQEDIAILSLGKVIAICFCAPSGFIPSNVVGKTFFEIHQPIPDSEILLKMSDKLSSMLSDTIRGPYRRHIWTITANPSRSQHPSMKDNFNPKSISDLYFRTETQTTIPLDDNVHMLFAIKVDMSPLNVIWEDFEMKKTLLESIDSMSEAMLVYKNLQSIKSILNNSN